MWTWIIILLVVGGGLAIWMGTRKEGGNEEGVVVDSEASEVSETPEPSENETPLSEEPSEEPSEKTSEDVFTEESEDKDKPSYM